MISLKLPIHHPPLRRLLLFGGVLVSVAIFSGCAVIRARRGSTAAALTPTVQPDKVLLQEALHEFQHGRYDVGRLTLQTLINTYPDSEYLSQSKLAIADSYYRQGGLSGLTEAEAEYKDFMTFFPNAPEAPMAEYRAGMCHFRLMGKADRDQTEAKEAEREFKEFLTEFPHDPLMPKVKDRLRETQEVLADGDYEIAELYYEKGDYPAAESRLKEIANRYPSYSHGDQVFWRLSQTLTRLHQTREAVPYDDRLVMEFPLSPLVKDAKAQLAALHEPIPKPTDAELARAQADAIRDDRRSFFSKAFGGFSGAPDVASTLHGPVILGSPNHLVAEIAQLNHTAVTPAPASRGQNSIGVETASLATLNSAKPVDPNSRTSGTATATAPKPASPSQRTAATSKGSSSASPPPKKKKGKFHFFKKLIP